MALRCYIDPITKQWTCVDFQNLVAPKISANSIILDGVSEETKKKILDVLKSETKKED